MTFPPNGPTAQIQAGNGPDWTSASSIASDTPAGREFLPIKLLDEEADPGSVVLTYANCGAAMDERKCKLICLSGSHTAIVVRRHTGLRAV